MWRENRDGEWYWPLHPNRQQDHLRVWQLGGRDAPWQGVLVIDGEYLDVCRTHKCATAEQAKGELWGIASLYLRLLADSLTR